MRYPLSILDLIPVAVDTAASAAVCASLDLARLAEELGYTRYWISEHHGIRGICSTAPEILLARIGALTENIRIGSGGIMLPNHPPLRVAEAFQTLEALYPGRVDLGLGRAPGTDQRTSRALGAEPAERFSELLNQMLGLSRGSLSRTHPYAGVTVMPDDVLLPPIWILGSSGASAGAAGAAGMGYSFANYFSASPPAPALARYRETFRPSAQFPEPHTILAVPVACAPSDEEAEYLAASFGLAWLQLEHDDFSPLPTPEQALAYDYTDAEREAIAKQRECYVIGSPGRVAARLDALMTETGADEIMVVSNIHDPEARLRSYRLLQEVMN